MIRVVVSVDGEATMRAAHSLAAHPGVTAVALLSPATSTQFDVVESVEGHDLVMGTERAADLAATHGLPAIVAGHAGDTVGLFGGSPAGLALALAVGLEEVEMVAVAMPGAPEGDSTVVFPSPIDGRSAVLETVDGHPVHFARHQGDLGAAMVTGAHRHRVIIDDHRFLAGVSLAAAAAAYIADPVSGPTPVWTQAEAYLQAAVDMGLVIGERAAA